MSDEVTETTATELPKVDLVPQPGAAAKPVDTTVSSNITGLQSGAFQAALVGMRQKIAARQTNALNRIDNAVMIGASKIEAAADDVAQKVDKEIAAALQEFAQHTNGGPA